MKKQFNPMTIVAAAEVISTFKSQSDLQVLAVQWQIAGRCDASSKSARVASLAQIAIGEDVQVMTEQGVVPLERALVETAIKSPAVHQTLGSWPKLIAGLRFDGFEVVQVPVVVPGASFLNGTANELKRMYPEDVPDLEFREAESEIIALLDWSGFTTAKGHLVQAQSAFQRAEWSSANGELRNFFESYLNEIAVSLGYSGTDDSKAKRDYLGNLTPPFLISEYNEWHSNNQKPQFFQGLMSRMHPHGGHAGLSEEEDATFRLHITLVTARLILRRFRFRKGSVQSPEMQSR